MSDAHDRLRHRIATCSDVSELLDIAETCIRASTLLGQLAHEESALWSSHATHALLRVGTVRDAEVSS